MRLPLGIAALFCAQFVTGALHGAGRDGDFAWQQWLGEGVLRTGQLPRALGIETFTAAGAPWVPQEWLFSTLYALAERADRFDLFAAAVALCAVLALACVALDARRRGASALSSAIIVLGTAIAMEQMFNVRAQIVAWPLFAVLLVVAGRDDRLAFAAIPVTVLWANVHASAMLAPLATFAIAIGRTIEPDRTRERIVRSALVCAGCAAATLVTPFGIALPLYAVHLVASPIKDQIQEWRSVAFTDPSYALGFFVLLIALIVAHVAGAAVPRRDLPLAFFAIALSTGAVRNLPFAAIALAPIAAAALASMMPDSARMLRLLREAPIAAVFFIALSAACATVAYATDRAERASPPALPARAIAAAASLPGTRRLFCEDFAWCSLALEHRNLRTFIDGRCDPFPLAIWNAYRAIERRGALAPLDRFKVNTVIASGSGVLAGALRADRRWRLAARTQSALLFIRKPEPGARESD